MDTKTYQLLQKVLPQIKKKPESMKGFVSSRKIGLIGSTGNIHLNDLTCAAANHLFDDKPERFGIALNEGEYIRSYLQHKADQDPDLKEKFPYLV